MSRVACTVEERPPGGGQVERNGLCAKESAPAQAPAPLAAPGPRSASDGSHWQSQGRRRAGRGQTSPEAQRRLVRSIPMARSVIVSAVRTPFAKLGGGLASYEATELGALVIKAALERIGVEANEPQYIIMGQVLQGGAGQAPARQAAIGAGLPKETPADTIHKG